MKYCNIRCVCFTSLCSLIEDGLNEFSVLSSRVLFTYQDSRTPITKSECPLLPAHRVWKAQAFATLRLPHPTGQRIFILPLGTEKQVLLGLVTQFTEGQLCVEYCTTSSGTSNLSRELTLSRTCACVRALRSRVYVLHVCVYGNSKMYTPTIVFVHNEIVSYLITKHIISLCTIRMETSIKMFLNKNQYKQSW